MSDAVPAGVPAATADAARESAAGALTVAGRLPGPVVAAARDAFTTGMHLVSAIAAACLAAAAVLVMVKLRHVPPLGAGAAPAEETTGTPADDQPAEVV
jgi:DHA2 family multidrug resistance protein-like MFS transporter